MIRPTLYTLRKVLEDNGYDIFRYRGKPYNLNIVGVRNRLGRPNYFDDTITVFWETPSTWKIEYFSATTLPGYPYLLRPASPKGTAMLVPGQYKGAYKIGLHQGKYPALVQRKAVKVYRDASRDLIYNYEPNTIEEGMFGINIHKASLYSKVVGFDSAGCQVIQNRKDYDEFMNLCEQASKQWGNILTYTLVEL